MIIAIGTTNEAKLSACHEVFVKTFGKEVQIRSYNVPSGIDAMPMTNEQSAQGALNRAQAALAADELADIGVGLEGGVFEGPLDRMYLNGWVVIVNRLGLVGVGHSGGVALPNDIAHELRNGAELGPLMHKRTGDDVRHTIGTTGLLTNGLYPRDQEFTNAISTALAPFVAPEYYK